MRFAREGTISSWTAAFLVERVGFLSVRVVDSACWVYIPTKMSGFLSVGWFPDCQTERIGFLLVRGFLF